MTRKSNTISELLLQNGTASLKNLYPLTQVQTEADKKELAAQGYNPGFTVDEWPYKLPKERIFYSKNSSLAPTSMIQTMPAFRLPSTSTSTARSAWQSLRMRKLSANIFSAPPKG